MTREEAIEYWEQFNAEIDDLYDICSDADRDTLIKQREIVEYTISTLRQQDEPKPLSAFLAPMNCYKGLKRKFLVFKSDSGEMVENCFVLRPDKDPAAVSALRAYADATDNKVLSADIINWVGAERKEPLTLDELRKMDGDPVWVVWPDGRIKSQWFIVGSTFWIDMFVEWDGTLSKDYGKTWLAYSQKKEV